MCIEWRDWSGGGSVGSEREMKDGEVGEGCGCTGRMRMVLMGAGAGAGVVETSVVMMMAKGKEGGDEGGEVVVVMAV